jgi:hypothetical protein
MFRHHGSGPSRLGKKTIILIVAGTLLVVAAISSVVVWLVVFSK